MPPDLQSRVAVLEEMAASTKAALERIDRRFETLEARLDRRFEAIDRNQRSDFRWMLSGFAGVLVAMAALFWRVNDIAVMLARTTGH